MSLNMALYNALMHTYVGISKCSIMEVLVVHAREHLNVTSLDGNTPLHFAAYHGHTQVCSLLAAQVYKYTEYRTENQVDSNYYTILFSYSHNLSSCTFQASVNIKILLT